MSRSHKKRPERPTWAGVVKVQRSLVPRDVTVLFTSRDGMIHSQLPMTPELLRWFDDDEPKFYARATLRHTLIHIVRKHDGHSW